MRGAGRSGVALPVIWDRTSRLQEFTSAGPAGSRLAGSWVCNGEAPDLSTVAKAHAGVVFAGVANDRPADADAFMSKHALGSRVIADPGGAILGSWEVKGSTPRAPRERADRGTTMKVVLAS